MDQGREQEVQITDTRLKEVEGQMVTGCALVTDVVMELGLHSSGTILSKIDPDHERYMVG